MAFCRNFRTNGKNYKPLKYLQDQMIVLKSKKQNYLPFLEPMNFKEILEPSLKI